MYRDLEQWSLDRRPNGSCSWMGTVRNRPRRPPRERGFPTPRHASAIGLVGLLAMAQTIEYVT